MFALFTIAMGLPAGTAAAGGAAISSNTTFNISNTAGGGDCAARGIGAWNASTLTCTLTTDITMTAPVDGISINSDGVSLNGNGHTMTGNGSGEPGVLGVYLSGRTGVKVWNLNVTNFGVGIALNSSSSNAVLGNTPTRMAPESFLTASPATISSQATPQIIIPEAG